MSKKFFIHIPKNGGMTIRHAGRTGPLKGMVQEAGPQTHKSKKYTQSVLKHMNSIGDHHGYEHARWRDINPDYTSKMNCFALIRNPWDRVVSRYFFAKKVIEVEKKEPIGKHNIDSFEHFLEERFEWGNIEYMWHRAIRGWYPAFDHVSDEDGNVMCDILRTEHLNEDVCKYFGIKEMSRARNVTALNDKSYTDIYTPETIQIVADWYKKDIDYWGFDFDTSANKNYWNIQS